MACDEAFWVDQRDVRARKPLKIPVFVAECDKDASGGWEHTRSKFNEE